MKLSHLFKKPIQYIGHIVASRSTTSNEFQPQQSPITQRGDVISDMRQPQDETYFNPNLIHSLDQGTLDPRHSKEVIDFIDLHFIDNNQFSPEKIKKFINDLRHQRETIVLDLHETVISEKMQTDTKSYFEASKKSDIRGLENSADVLMGFDQFVLPTALKIEQLVNAHIDTYANQVHVGSEVRGEALTSQHAILGLIREFINGYAPYYSPNKIRTYFRSDTEIGGIIKNMFLSHKIKKVDPNALEASNLVIPPEKHRDVANILDKEVPIGQCLSPEDIKKLNAHQFDLSLLNPEKHSPFWKKIDASSFLEELEEEAKLFPQPEEKLTYKGPRYRSWGSTKMSATFVRDGKKYLIKVKLGGEIHSDILCSHLRRAMGFYQDKMQHRENLTLHLGNKTYQEFERDISIKYGINTLKQAITERGVDKEGEEWVIFKCAALELRPESEIRATTIDPILYDGANHRELRARRLLRGFLSLIDTKPTNHRLVFQKDKSGTLRPQYRFQDPGLSFGTSVVIQRPRDLLRFPLTKNKIEEYDRNYVRVNKKGDVRITYNDAYFHKRDDDKATYADFKWMARVIGTLSDDIIKHGIEHAGIPEDLQSIYFYHIGNMKNRTLKAFDLEREVHHENATLPISISQIGRLKDINVPEVVKNGKITATHVPGRLMLPKLQETWFTFFNRISGMVKQDAVSTPKCNRLISC